MDRLFDSNTPRLHHCIRNSSIAEEPLSCLSDALSLPSFVSFTNIPSDCSMPRNHRLNGMPLPGGPKCACNQRG